MSCVYCNEYNKLYTLKCGHGICELCAKNDIYFVDIPKPCKICKKRVGTYLLKEEMQNNVCKSASINKPNKQRYMTIEDDIVRHLGVAEAMRIENILGTNIQLDNHVLTLNSRIVITNKTYNNLFFYGIVESIIENNITLNDCIAYTRDTGHTYTCSPDIRLIELKDEKIYVCD